MSELEGPLLAAIQAIHSTETKAVVYATGGAVQVKSSPFPSLHVPSELVQELLTWFHQALSWLLIVPGASNTILEASVPYSRQSLMEILDGKVRCV